MQVRSLARKFKDAALRTARGVELRIGLRRLEGGLSSGRPLGAAVLEQLARGWGNQWWSASTPLLAAMLDWLPKTSGPIVECGSGLSTLVLAAAAARSGRTVISLEHEESWADRVLRALPTHLRPYVSLRVTPIRSFGDFDWYSVDPEELPTSIALVLCDGPPGATRGGRYGLAPVLATRLATGCVVILDDTQRPGEHAVLERWRSEFRASVVEEGGTYSVIEIGEPRRITS